VLNHVFILGSMTDQHLLGWSHFYSSFMGFELLKMTALCC